MSFVIKPVPDPREIPALQPLFDHENDGAFDTQLLQSLNTANNKAKEKDVGLKPELYDALPLDGMNGRWPTTFDEYVNYLAIYSRWIPHQSADEAWVNPTIPDLGEHREVYDYLCWFYWLIDQDLGDEFGYFTFGGSDIIVLTQKGTNLVYNPAFVKGTEYYSLHGSLFANVTPLKT